MKRITITLSDEIAAALDQYMSESGAQNRSEAIRDLVRRAMLDRPEGPEDADCLGVVSYTVDQTTRNLGARLAKRRLDAHDRHLTSLSIPLDHSTALEIEVTHGKLRDVASTAETLFLERGVAHGSLSLVPVTASGTHHVHEGERASPHHHIQVQQSFSKSHKKHEPDSH
ncbi:CopG family transcriptional regulator, nickel-responsive regulator [Cohaesibacter sp. ES.047]|uniref:nickel-responsive transcriptional regulator NikR n=1 Tax=Cohaesibacter sp. ES.047 TaxID=1798205 RepID=UPI000BB999C5|nr:nickel-responsive transcriptional regulator NikR [Cohaesibacter sp. ES.047]SNY91998.1 CopG family transcriptional regulator, nickel-responsive regulator [Cohaesibacter sp. ES.047]